MWGKITGIAKIPITTNMVIVKRLQRFSMILSYLDTCIIYHKLNLNELVQQPNA